MDTRIMKPTDLLTLNSMYTPMPTIINLDKFTENYPQSFYHHYFQRWPTLNFIAHSMDGRPMGYIMAKSEGAGSNWHGHVTILTVSPTYRRLGVARILMSRLERVCDDGQMFFVDLFVRSSNEGAIGMYTKLGYCIYRRIIGYYSGPDEDAFEMRKSLSRDLDGISMIRQPDIDVEDLYC